ncbi:MAG: alginate export family protein [Bdellovibrionales bacterium]|nr:alginate export family protein [Bdellovibrionales bacterium]
MTKKVIISTLSFVSLIFFHFPLYSYEANLSGGGRVRYESISNSDFVSNVEDYKSFTGSRFWLNGDFKVSEYHLFFQPQFSRTWGLDEAGVGSTSGATNDPRLNVHQAYIQFPFLNMENVSLKLGRQEFAYGDELVLGPVGWSNVGRSFDALKAEMKYEDWQLDLFSSKLSDKNSTSPSDGDRDLHGAYLSGRRDKEFLQETDLYFLNLNESTTNPRVDLLAYGLRLKGHDDSWDYRFEFTQEDIDSEFENQGDAEVGYKFSKNRLAFNYFNASKAYNQMYPTAHKWLGAADVLSRKNIEGFQVKHGYQWSESLRTDLSYFNFSRQSTNATAYTFSGAALGSTTLTNKEVGQEFDLILNYIQSSELSYQLGGAQFLPGKYLKDSGYPDSFLFIYLQVLLKI